MRDKRYCFLDIDNTLLDNKKAAIDNSDKFHHKIDENAKPDKLFVVEESLDSSLGKLEEDIYMLDKLVLSEKYVRKDVINFVQKKMETHDISDIILLTTRNYLMPKNMYKIFSPLHTKIIGAMYVNKHEYKYDIISNFPGSIWIDDNNSGYIAYNLSVTMYHVPYAGTYKSLEDSTNIRFV